MKKNTAYFLLVFMLFVIPLQAQDFITTWETATASEMITIPTAPGETYLYDVDWENDGTFDDIGVTGDATHTYPTAGVHAVAIRGVFPQIFFNNSGDTDKIIIVNQWGDNQWTSMANAFEGCSNLVIAAPDTPDLSLATDLSAMFKDVTALNTDIGNWDVGTITDMSEMFNGATNFDQNLGSWNVASVTNMTDMFANTALSIQNYDNLLIGWALQLLQTGVNFNAGTSEFCFGTVAKQTIESVYGWVITDGGENCGNTFVTTWKTDNPGTSAANEITIPTSGSGYMYEVDWGDGSRSTNLTGNSTHTYASAGTYTVKIRGNFPRIYFNNEGDKEKLLSVENWGAIAWTSMEAAFYGCSNLRINALDVPDLSGATSLAQMFKGAISLNDPIDTWDVTTITNLSETFSGATDFNQSLNGWVTTALENMDGTFLQSGFNQPIDAWDVSNVNSMKETFAESPFNQPLPSWITTNVLSMDSMFANALDFNQDISAWDVSNVINMQGMFLNAESFNQPLNLWTPLAVETTEGMFSNTEVFNQPLDTWFVPTSMVTNMSGMFTNAKAFNQPIGNWTVNNVTNMSNMFNGALAFDQDLSAWQVAMVEDMSFMFASAELFNQDIGGWTVSNVITMENMFNNALLFNQDIGGWDTSSVQNMVEMFTAAEAFDQNIGGWDVSMVTDMENMFAGASLSIANYDALLNGWNAQTLQNGVNFNGGTSRYCTGAVARQNMIDNDLWQIIDAGAENVDPVPDIPTLPDITSECAVTTIPAPTATDACTGGITGTTDAFPVTAQGETIITWTFDDGNGNSITQNQKVIITDATAPVISSVSNITVSATAGQCDAVVTYTPPMATDNCDFTVVSTHNSGDTFPVGITSVTYTATDTAGNSDAQSTTTFTVTVTDDEAPVFSGCLTSFTVNSEIDSCGAVVNYTAPTASDNCFASVSSSHNPGQFFPVGDTAVTYIATDNGGNSATCSFTITVLDTVDPVISGCPSDIIVSNDTGACGAVVNYAAPSVVDNCGATFSASHNPGDTFPVGVTTVFYTATDAAGNADTCSFTVTVEDTSDPIISSCPFNITQNADPGVCTAVVTWTPPLQTDNCSATLSSTHNPGDTFSAGETTVVYTATDASGNTDTCSFTVTITENEAPVISNCPSNIVMTNDPGNCSAVVSWTPPSQTDNCGATLVGSHVPGDTFAVGSTMVTYVATDTSGNQAVCSFTVTVEDTENPIINSCPTNISVTNDLGQCDAEVSWVVPLATDNCSVTLVSTHNPGDVFQLGTTTVTYTATDASGNEANCSFTITVADQEMPVITNCPVNITVPNNFGACEANVNWAAPTATDNCVGLTLTSSHASGDMFPVGTTTVTYTATDTAGNSTLCSFDVIVEDAEAPSVNCISDTTVFVDMTTYEVPDYISEGIVTVSDNCTDPVGNTNQTPAAGTQLEPGDYPVTITAIDAAGNETVCMFILSVEAVLGTPSEVDLGSLSFYPNPVSAKLIIDNPNNIAVETIQLYDVTGRMIQEIRHFNKTTLNIDVSELASASYVLLIKTEYGTLTKHIIKE